MTFLTNSSLQRMGTQYGGWTIPRGILNSRSICYSAGVGEDISFDLALVEKYQCRVYLFDPTPRSVQFMRSKHAQNSKLVFRPVGLWKNDEDQKFFVPQNSEHVSHSILNIQKTEKYFTAKCKTLSSLMREFGHQKIDLLKMDIEGAEYAVIESILADNVAIKMLCVEFDEMHHPIDAGFRNRIEEALQTLRQLGFRKVFSEKSNFTFINDRFSN